MYYTYHTQTLLPSVSVSSSLEENTTSKNRVYAHQIITVSGTGKTSLVVGTSAG